MHTESWKSLDVPYFLKTWSYMWGPGIAAIICFAIFGTSKRTITFFGTSKIRSLVVWIVPFIIIFLLTRNTDILKIVTLGYIATLGEELGWRGWLQDHLDIKSDFKKAIVIGTMWELWHFTNRTSNGELLQIVMRVGIFLVMCSILSYLALKLTKRTSSLTIAVALHGFLNLSVELDNAWIAVLCSFPIWAYLIWTWPQPDPHATQITDSL